MLSQALQRLCDRLLLFLFLNISEIALSISCLFISSTLYYRGAWPLVPEQRMCNKNIMNESHLYPLTPEEEEEQMRMAILRSLQEDRFAEVGEKERREELGPERVVRTEGNAAMAQASPAVT